MRAGRSAVEEYLVGIWMLYFERAGCFAIRSDRRLARHWSRRRRTRSRLSCHGIAVFLPLPAVLCSADMSFAAARSHSSADFDFNISSGSHMITHMFSGILT